MLKRKTFLILVLTLLMIFFLLGVAAAQAKTLAAAYEKLKERAEYATLINQLTITGKVYQNEVEQYIYDLSEQLAKENLTAENFDSLFLNQALNLIIQQKYENLREAVLIAFPSEINDFFQQGKLPATFATLKDALKQEMFGDSSGGGSPGGSSGVLGPALKKPGLEPGLEQPLPLKKINVTFKDVPTGYWAWPEIEFMAARSMIKGVGNELFKPEAQVTRAEFAAIIQRAVNLPPAGKDGPEYTDVPADAWFYAPVKAAAAVALVKGTGEGFFEPYRPINREEVATIITRVYLREQDSLPPGAGLAFADAAQISSWAKEAIAVAVKLEIVKGIDERHFAPRQRATRAQAVVMVKRLLEALGKI